MTINVKSIRAYFYILGYIEWDMGSLYKNGGYNGRYNQWTDAGEENPPLCN